MKSFLIIALLLFCNLKAFGQQATVEMRVNGVLNQTTLSISKDNLLILSGTGCDKYSISGSGVSLTKTETGFLVTPSGIKKNATITVTCIIDGKRTDLCTYKFTIVE